MIDFFQEGLSELCSDLFCKASAAVGGTGRDVAEGGDFVSGRIGVDAGDAYQAIFFPYAEVLIGLEHSGVEPVVGVAMLVEP